jgi:hypothetical protein
MDIPKTRKMSDAERFCYGLRELSVECNLASVNYNMFGITSFQFEDGSSVGGMTAYQEAGIITSIPQVKF